MVKISSAKCDEVFGKWRNFLSAKFFAKQFFSRQIFITDKYLLLTNIFYWRNYLVSNWWKMSLSINLFFIAFLWLKTYVVEKIYDKVRYWKNCIWKSRWFSSLRKKLHEKNLQPLLSCEGVFNPLEYFVCWLDSLCYTSFIKPCFR